MAGLTASGIGSGLDIDGLVNQLMTFEARPLTVLSQKEASYQAKVSAFGQIKSSLSSLQTAANALKNTATFSATTATVADTDQFSATSSASGATGNYSVEVKALAREQRIATSATAGFTPAAGDLTITFGTVADGAFTAGEDGAKTLSFAGGSLEEFRDAINDAGLGVRASVVDNGTVKQLVVRGEETGAAQAFQIGGSTGLSYDPTVEGVSTDAVYRLAAASDSRVNVDGIEVTRASNTLTDVVEGITLTLKKADPDNPTTLGVTADKAPATAAIEAFVKAYNAVASTLKTQTGYNADTQTASTLTGDSAARSVQTQLRNIMSASISEMTGTTSLSSIGIGFTASGTLEIDGTRLSEALADADRNVNAFFTGQDEVEGFAARIATQIGNYVNSDGLIAGRTEGINASIKRIDQQRTSIESRLTATEARYRAQFTALDAIVASMTTTSNFLTQQLDNLPGAVSSK